MLGALVVDAFVTKEGLPSFDKGEFGVLQEVCTFSTGVDELCTSSTGVDVLHGITGIDVLLGLDVLLRRRSIAVPTVSAGQRCGHAWPKLVVGENAKSGAKSDYHS